jgi:hypothetical protein
LSINERGKGSTTCTSPLLREWLLHIQLALTSKYRSLLTRMQLTSRAWIESLNTPELGRGKTYQKHESVSLQDFLSTGRHLLHVFIYKTSTVKFMHSSNHTNTTAHSCIISHAQNTTAIQPNVFLTGIHRLLVTRKGRSSFPSANNCQGQMQTPQSVSVSTFCPQLAVVIIVVISPNSFNKLSL